MASSDQSEVPLLSRLRPPAGARGSEIGARARPLPVTAGIPPVGKSHIGENFAESVPKTNFEVA